MFDLFEIEEEKFLQLLHLSFCQKLVQLLLQSDPLQIFQLDPVSVQTAVIQLHTCLFIEREPVLCGYSPDSGYGPPQLQCPPFSSHI